MSVKQLLTDSIESNGWHLNNEYIESLLQDKPNINANDVIRCALDTDLKSIGKKHLPDGIMNGKSDSFEGPCVLQVAKIRNIAAPKDNETSNAAPAFFKVTLTDGVSNCNALVMGEIPNLNLDTPPGTKILLKGIVKTKSSSLQLTNNSCQVLGGAVENLINKWKISKQMSNHIRSGNTQEGAPPPWVPFGSKQTIQTIDTTKKSLQQVSKEEDTTSEFSQARQAALDEALREKLKLTKNFMQPTVNPIQSSVNPLQSSVNTVQSSENSNSNQNRQQMNASSNRTDNFKKSGGSRFRNRNNADDDNDYKETQSKPSTMTLFDAIKTKLPIKDIESETSKQNESNQQQQTQKSRKETNYYNNPNADNTNAQIKERKPNLPPRFQRANDEKEQRYFNNSNNNSTNTNNYTNQRRPQKFNNYNSDTRKSTSTQSQIQQETYNKDDFAYDLNANKLNDKKQIQSQIPQAQQQQQQIQNEIQEIQETQSQQQNDSIDDNSNLKRQQNKKYQNSNQIRNDYTNIDTNQYYYTSKRNQNKITNGNPNIVSHIAASNNGYYIPQSSPAPLTVIPVSIAAATAAVATPIQSNTQQNSNVTNAAQLTPTNVAHAQNIYIPGIPLTQIYYDNSAQQQTQNHQYHPHSFHPHHHHSHYTSGNFAQQTSNTSNAYEQNFYCPTPLTGLPILVTPAQLQQTQQHIYTHIASPPQQSIPIQSLPVDQSIQQYDITKQNKNNQSNEKQFLNDSNNNINTNNDNNNNNKSKNMNNIQQSSRIWKKGDQCLAKYYDNRFYPAHIESIEKGSNICYVSYIGYNEGAEVKLIDLKPFKDDNLRQSNTTSSVVRK